MDIRYLVFMFKHYHISIKIKLLTIYYNVLKLKYKKILNPRFVKTHTLIIFNERLIIIMVI